MAKIDLSKMSLKELHAHRADVDAAIATAEQQDRKAALAAVEATAKKMGFTLDQLAGSGSRKTKAAQRAPAPAKYRHPENPEVTWSGRGRQPGWIKDALANGQALEEFAI